MLVIIPCGARKRPVKSAAYALYTGPYFMANLRYALSIAQRSDVYILSAKYGLLDLAREVEPYNLKMGQPGCVTVTQVCEQAEKLGILQRSPVIGLGGRLYTDIMRTIWPEIKLPLSGIVGIGKQMQWLNNHRGRI